MTDKQVADHFGMPLRTYARFKKAEYGSWRKNLYYLILEESLRVERHLDCMHLKEKELQSKIVMDEDQ